MSAMSAQNRQNVGNVSTESAKCRPGASRWMRNRDRIMDNGSIDGFIMDTGVIDGFLIDREWIKKTTKAAPAHSRFTVGPQQ